MHVQSVVMRGVRTDGQWPTRDERSRALAHRLFGEHSEDCGGEDARSTHGDAEGGLSERVLSECTDEAAPLRIAFYAAPSLRRR